MISSEGEQWGRYNLPIYNYIYIYISYPYIIYPYISIFHIISISNPIIEPLESRYNPIVSPYPYSYIHISSTNQIYIYIYIYIYTHIEYIKKDFGLQMDSSTGIALVASNGTQRLLRTWRMSCATSNLAIDIFGNGWLPVEKIRFQFRRQLNPEVFQQWWMVIFYDDSWRLLMANGEWMVITLWLFNIAMERSTHLQ